MSVGEYVSAPLILSALACMFVGYGFGARSTGKKAQGILNWRTEESTRLRLDAESRFIEVLRRELANIIVTESPDKMVALYRKAWAFEKEMQRTDSSRVQAEFGVLTERYPLYADFDLLGTRHFIPYSDPAGRTDEDAIAERYLDISKFMILENLQAKSSQTIFGDSEYETLTRAMRRETDHRLRARIVDAMTKYDMVRSANKDGGYQRIDYDDSVISIFPIDHFAELRWGLHFKDTHEYAIYSVFYHDDSRAFRSHYRSDSAFQVEERLHT
jgi:hypothetical protein